jgi:dihydroorotate dehydrogenase electron transfer subunit
MGNKSVGDFIVAENIRLNDTNFLLKLQSKDPIPEIRPGQFVNIDIAGCKEIFLRRPFSIFEADYNNQTVSLIVKILGRGSKKLTEIRPGEVLSLIYPLGRHFTYPQPGERILAVGGGSGLAPMLFLAKESGLPPENVDILIGARSASDHIDAASYSRYGNLYHTTEDGTLGFRGLVTQHPIFADDLKKYNRIYACGPDGMMKAIAKEAKKAGVECEVSLENLMACGFGVCLCCIEPTVNGNVCVCTEGPVFNINDLKWPI